MLPPTGNVGLRPDPGSAADPAMFRVLSTIQFGRCLVSV
jgi:hypothetical protein